VSYRKAPFLTAADPGYAVNGMAWEMNGPNYTIDLPSMQCLMYDQ